MENRSKSDIEAPVDTLDTTLERDCNADSYREDEHDEPVSAEEQPLTTAQLPFLRRHFILEPPIALANFAFNLSSTVYQNQLLYQSCKAIFHYSEDDCEPMLGKTANTNSTSQHIEDIIQPYVSRILMTGSLVQSIVPAVLSLFIGSWSDKFGRRPVLITTLIGSMLGYIISCILAAVSINVDVNPWLYTISWIPGSICGGTCALMIVVYCYIADVAPPQFKALRMVLNSAAVGIGSVLGTISSSPLFAATNMATVFGISIVALLLALLYICLVNEESIPVQACSLTTKIRGFFHYKLVVDMVRTCIAKRADFQRAFIWLTMTALVISNIPQQGETDVFYLFLRKKFTISLGQYTIYNTVSDAIEIIGGILGIIVLRKIFKISIVTMSMLTLCSCIVDSVIRAAAEQFWEIYLGTALGFLSGIASAMLLTTLSFATPTTEIGKIFALATALQTITPLAAAPLYTSVYNATLSYYPGLFNIISIALYLISLVCMCVIFILQRTKHITLQASEA